MTRITIVPNELDAVLRDLVFMGATIEQVTALGEQAVYGYEIGYVGDGADTGWQRVRVTEWTTEAETVAVTKEKAA